MSTPAVYLPAGSVPQTAGAPVDPTRIAAPTASPAHSFFNVIRDLVHKAGYHNESEVLAALDSILRYESKVVTPGDLNQVRTDNDRAAVEDIRLRPTPQTGIGQLPVLTPAPIDYNQLAAALAPYLAAQAAAAQQAQQAPPAQPPAPYQNVAQA